MTRITVLGEDDTPFNMDILLSYPVGTGTIIDSTNLDATSEYMLGIRRILGIDCYRIVIQPDGSILSFINDSEVPIHYQSLRVCLSVLMVITLMYWERSQYGFVLNNVRGPICLSDYLFHMATNRIFFNNPIRYIEKSFNWVENDKYKSIINNSYTTATLMLVLGKPEYSIKSAKLALFTYITMINCSGWYRQEPNVFVLAEFVAKCCIIAGDYKQAVEFIMFINKNSYSIGTDWNTDLIKYCKYLAFKSLQRNALEDALSYYKIAYESAHNLSRFHWDPSVKKSLQLEHDRLKKIHNNIKAQIVLNRTN